MNNVLERVTDSRNTRLTPTAHPHRYQTIGRPPTIGMILPVRVFLAAGWLRAGVEKLIDPAWWNGSVLRGFLHKQQQDAVPFFRPVMDHVIAPSATFVAITVMVAQLLCGVFIGTGKAIRLGLRVGFVMNVTFVLAGRVTPSAFYLVMELLLLFAIADGAMGVKPTTPSRRTFAAATVTAALAAVFIPYIRTLEPAKVIEDPAMMLTFIGFITAATLIVRRAAHPVHEHTRLGRLWADRLEGWAHAQPREGSLATSTVASPWQASPMAHAVPQWFEVAPEALEALDI